MRFFKIDDWFDVDLHLQLSHRHPAPPCHRFIHKARDNSLAMVVEIELAALTATMSMRISKHMVKESRWVSVAGDHLPIYFEVVNPIDAQLLHHGHEP